MKNVYLAASVRTPGEWELRCLWNEFDSKVSNQNRKRTGGPRAGSPRGVVVATGPMLKLLIREPKMNG